MKNIPCLIWMMYFPLLLDFEEHLRFIHGKDSEIIKDPWAAVIVLVLWFVPAVIFYERKSKDN